MADFSDLTLGAAAGASPYTAMGGKWYFVDPVNGKAGADGTTPRRASTSLEAMEDKLRANKHDGIFFICGATRNSLAAAITWDKSYTHLVGLGPRLASGMRSGILGSSTVDLTTLITLSGNACTFHGLKFVNEKDTGTSQGAIDITGERNLIEDCEIVGVCHATPGAGTTNVYDVKITGGGENTFRNCQIGADTFDRSAASAILRFASATARNYFEECRIVMHATAATALFAKVAQLGIDRYVWFKRCTFMNNGPYSAGLATDEAFDLATALGGCFYMDECHLVGATDWEAATVSGNVILNNPTGAVNGGLAITQTA
jgi:hypothetical protein